MGGLAIRAWLAGCDARQDKAVRRVITLGTPHHGTWLGQFSYTVNGAQMNLQSVWLNDLAALEKPHISAQFVCFYSNCDNIAFPVSTARLDGADNHFVEALGHVALAHDANVIKACWALMR